MPAVWMPPPGALGLPGPPGEKEGKPEPDAPAAPSAVRPPVMVKAVKVAVTPPVTWNTRELPPASMVMPREREDPSISTFLSTSSCPESMVMVAPSREASKRMVSPLA